MAMLLTTTRWFAFGAMLVGLLIVFCAFGRPIFSSATICDDRAIFRPAAAGAVLFLTGLVLDVVVLLV